MINIEKSNTSPEIIMEQNPDIMRIEGESYPENAFQFYAPVFEWFHTQFPLLDEFVLEVRLSYMNSTSTKCILDILDILNEASTEGKKIQVRWFYQKDNSRALDLAEEFKEDLQLPFELIAYE